MAETQKNVSVTTEKNAPATRAGIRQPFETLRAEVDRLFDEFSPGFPRIRSGFGLTWPKGTWEVMPAVDVTEKDDAYEVTAELPGMDENGIEVKLADGMLTIKGEKKEEKEEEKKDYRVSERRYGMFQRSLQVPEGVDIDKVAANFAKGVLTVTLPKSAEAKKNEKKIAVKAG
jgi:HSP20 family protein